VRGAKSTQESTVLKPTKVPMHILMSLGTLVVHVVDQGEPGRLLAVVATNVRARVVISEPLVGGNNSCIAYSALSFPHAAAAAAAGEAMSAAAGAAAAGAGAAAVAVAERDKEAVGQEE